MRVTEILMDYFKRATEIDLSDTHIKRVCPSKISLSVAWHNECLDAALASKRQELTPTERMELFIGLISKAPLLRDSQKENCIIHEGAIEYESRTVDKD